MLRILSLLFGLIARSVRLREALLFENLALRHQLAVCLAKTPSVRVAAVSGFVTNVDFEPTYMTLALIELCHAPNPESSLRSDRSQPAFS
jgi:hypothetical protein